MRCTQLMGLSDDAEVFLAENAKKVPARRCPECGHPIAHAAACSVYEDAKHLGMFEDGPELHEYELKDGRRIREVEQATVWSSGPCIFLALQFVGEDELVFPWAEEDIAAA